MTRLIDLTGKKFGKLTVVRRAEKRSLGKVWWLCSCDCGNMTTTNSQQLKDRKTKSCGCLKLRGYGEASFNSIFNSYKRGAKYRGLEFHLTKDEFRYLTAQNCHYCGASPMNSHQSNGCVGEYVYNGIDRVDSAVGYIKENCVPCCAICNRAKTNRNRGEFMDWIIKVYNYNFVNLTYKDMARNFIETK